jgi:hypothetical protein
MPPITYIRAVVTSIYKNPTVVDALVVAVFFGVSKTTGDRTASFISDVVVAQINEGYSRIDGESLTNGLRTTITNIIAVKMEMSDRLVRFDCISNGSYTFVTDAVSKEVNSCHNRIVHEFLGQICGCFVAKLGVTSTQASSLVFELSITLTLALLLLTLPTW